MFNAVIFNVGVSRVARVVPGSVGGRCLLLIYVLCIVLGMPL
jgi:hypothetical protein